MSLQRSDKVTLYSEVTSAVSFEIDDEGHLFIEQDGSHTIRVEGEDIDDFVQELRNLVERKRKTEPDEA